jgi:hypothetical protein
LSFVLVEVDSTLHPNAAFEGARGRRIAIVNAHYYPDEHDGSGHSLRFLVETAAACGHVCTVFAA